MSSGAQAPSRHDLLLLVLLLLVIGSALAVAYTAHWNRQLLNELFVEVKEHDRVQFEWGRLVLEQGTWTTYARIEGAAVHSLGMRIPERKDIQVIR